MVAHPNSNGLNKVNCFQYNIEVRKMMDIQTIDKQNKFHISLCFLFSFSIDFSNINSMLKMLKAIYF